MSEDADFLDKLAELYDVEIEEYKDTTPESQPLYCKLQSENTRYSDIKPISSGGMKTISSVFDPKTGRYAAMATLPPDAPEELYEPFLREARLTALLDHPNCITIYDIGLDENSKPYFTMELKTGESLDGMLKDVFTHSPSSKPVSKIRSNLLEIFVKICDAIAYAHSNNILHLDLKPENIQVGRYGEVIVCDWGIGKLIGDVNYDGGEFDHLLLNQDLLNNMTLVGEIKGTPGYMAPEQIMRDGKKTKATDIYSLGAVLYTLLTGSHPINKRDVTVILDKTLKGEITPPQKRFPTYAISKGLSAICMKALALDPADRYKSVEELRTDVHNYATGYLTSAESGGIIKELLLFFKRNRTVCLQALASLVVVIGITAWFLYSLNHSRIVAEHAQHKAETNATMYKAEKEKAETHLQKYKAEKEKIVAIHKKWETDLVQDTQMLRLHYFWGDHPRAIEQMIWRLNRVLKINPDNKRAISWKGNMFFLMQQFDRALRTFQLSDEKEKDLHAEAKKMTLLPKDENGLISINELAALIDRLSTADNNYFNRKYISERMMSYDMSKRQNSKGYAPVVEQLLRAWNMYKGHQFSFNYDESKKTLRIHGEGLSILESYTSMGPGKCLIRFLPIEVLDISHTNVEKLKHIKELIYLQKLDIRHTEVTDLEPLKNHPALHRLVVTPEQRSTLDFRNIPEGIKVQVIQ